MFWEKFSMCKQNTCKMKQLLQLFNLIVFKDILRYIK